MGLSEKRRFRPDKPVGEPEEASFGCSRQLLPPPGPSPDGRPSIRNCIRQRLLFSTKVS